MPYIVRTNNLLHSLSWVKTSPAYQDILNMLKLLIDKCFQLVLMWHSTMIHYDRCYMWFLQQQKKIVATKKFTKYPLRPLCPQEKMIMWGEMAVNSPDSLSYFHKGTWNWLGVFGGVWRRFLKAWISVLAGKRVNKTQNVLKMGPFPY